MKSIRRQLTRELLGATFALLSIGLLALYFAARDAAYDQFDDALRAKALAISTLTIRTPSGVELDFSNRFFRGFDDRKPRDFFELWDENDRPITRSESVRRANDLPRRTGKLDRPARWNLELPNDRAGRAIGFVFKPKASGLRDRPNREVQLVVASDREKLDETLWQLLGISVGCGVLLLGGTLWIIPRVLRRGLEPINALGEQVMLVDADSLATRFSSEQMPSELQPVARRLNDLLGRLEQSFERERRFSADLAHELRTPLAELRSMAECALKWPHTRDPETADRETLAVAKHMEAIVTHILALARGEQGQLVVKREAIEIESLVQTTWQQYVTRAAERNLSVRLSLEPVTAFADAALLRSILFNLFDNAVSHATAGGEIAIVLENSPTGASLKVTNTTDDLEPDDVPKLFERFWRKESARSGGHHVGLGLSLARSLADAMQWTLTATLHEKRTLTFTLTAPAT